MTAIERGSIRVTFLCQLFLRSARLSFIEGTSRGKIKFDDGKFAFDKTGNGIEENKFCANQLKGDNWNTRMPIWFFSCLETKISWKKKKKVEENNFRMIKRDILLDNLKCLFLFNKIKKFLANFEIRYCIMCQILFQNTR